MKAHCRSIIVIFFYVALLSTRSIDAKLGKVIIDTDAGADDAVAILLLLQYESAMPNELQVLAITCTYGNTYVQNVEQNVLKTLTIANRSDIPVYSGAQRSLLHNYTGSDYFGHDGFGDFNFTEEITASIDRTRHAANALVHLVKAHPNEITILNIGPLTNVATAIALEPLFLKYLKNHIIMGSSVAGFGNAKPGVEYNFKEDPESNFMVLNSTIEPCILFPWETCVGNSITKDWRLNILGERDSTIVHFLNKAERIYLNKTTLWTVSDAMAVAVAIRPEFITKSTIKNVFPITEGQARGSVLVDYAESTSRPKNAQIVQGFNTSAFQKLLLDTLG